MGHDIFLGDYKLSTKVKMNPEYDNLGWDITIVNVENEKHEIKYLYRRITT